MTVPFEHGTSLLAGEHFADGAGVPGAATLSCRDSVAGQPVCDASQRRTGIGLEPATNGLSILRSGRFLSCPV